MECPYCHGQVPEGATFCQNCGAGIQGAFRPVETNQPYQPPVEERPIEPINNNNNNYNANRKPKRSNGSTLILILIIVAVIIGVRMFSKKDESDNTNKNTNNSANASNYVVDTEVLDNDNAFLMYIEYVYDDYGKTFVSGKILRGEVKTGDKIELITKDGDIKEVKVDSLSYYHKDVDSAKAGDDIGIFLSGVSANDLEGGEAIAKQNSIKPRKGVEAEIYFYTVDEGGTDNAISGREKLNIEIGDSGKFDCKISLDETKAGETMTTFIELDKYMALEVGSEFMLRDDIRFVGKGTVTKVYK